MTKAFLLLVMKTEPPGGLQERAHTIVKTLADCEAMGRMVVEAQFKSKPQAVYFRCVEIEGHAEPPKGREKSIRDLLENG
jgi:hypothetical protein